MLEGINHLVKIMQTEGVLKSFKITDTQRKAVKEKVSSLHLNFHLYHNSLNASQRKVCFLIEEKKVKKLISFTPRKDNDDGFVADKVLNLDGFRVKVCPLTHENALVMREVFSYTAPTVLGTEPAFGTGDRIGGKVSATSGHIRALKDYNVAAFFA
ncbi:hypothetical protein KAV79_01085, partial [Candidatus Aerophobetes bacterium]|nr:hypothetical protein [Candidatus Aerophobetes bacterium]